MIQPLNRNILVEVKEKEKEVNVGTIKIVLASSSEDQRLEIATVLAVASDVESVKKGDVIHFKAYSLSEVEIDKKIYGFLKEDELLAKE